MTTLQKKMHKIQLNNNNNPEDFNELNAVQLLDGPIIRTSASSARCSCSAAKYNTGYNMGL